MFIAFNQKKHRAPIGAPHAWLLCSYKHRAPPEHGPPRSRECVICRTHRQRKIVAENQSRTRGASPRAPRSINSS